jgi:hypothetical protein
MKEPMTMPDTRKGHFTYPATPTSLMNQETPPFPGAGAALYTKYGPRGPANTGRQRKPLSTPPQSLEEHIQDALARIPDLSSKQKLALRNVLMAMCRDISFIRCIHEQAQSLGPHSDQAAGIPMDQGRPL